MGGVGFSVGFWRFREAIGYKSDNKKKNDILSSSSDEDDILSLVFRTIFCSPKH